VGRDLALLWAVAPQVAQQLKGMPGLRDVWTDQESAALQFNLVIKREAANRQRVKVSDIASALNNAFAPAADSHQLQGLQSVPRGAGWCIPLVLATRR
jgi:Cu/Ag efflux pump CusA